MLCCEQKRVFSTCLPTAATCLKTATWVLEDTGDALLANEAVRSAYLGG
jgi:ABC-type branched-subunit amino acid transport system ATPase component